MLLTVKEKLADNSREFSILTGHLSYSDINEIHFNLIDQAHFFTSRAKNKASLFYSQMHLTSRNHYPLYKNSCMCDFSQCCQFDFLEKHIFI